jgi:hypothetical protein
MKLKTSQSRQVLPASNGRHVPDGGGARIPLEGDGKRRPYLSLALMAGVIALGLFGSGGDASAQSTWTTMRARVVHADFDFPANFEAERAIAIHDSNGNCIIDSYTLGNDYDEFPFTLITPSVTIGRHIGSPFTFVPNASAPCVAPMAMDGFCGHTLIYGEMDQNGTTYFMWFALPDGTSTPNGYNPQWRMDFGVGSYSGSDPRNSRNVYHATYVKDAFASNGNTADHAGPPSDIHWWTSPPGTFASPGHLFSTDPDPTQPWPSAWGLFVAATLACDPSQAFFVVFDNVVIDVPLVAEENWDGAMLYPAQVGVGRTISPLSGGQSLDLSNMTAPAVRVPIWRNIPVAGLTPVQRSTPPVLKTGRPGGIP